MLDLQPFTIYKEPASYTKITIDINSRLEVVEEYLTYTMLSYIAEIGGYVGLFLGFSVYQVTDIMDMIFNKFFA